MQATQEQQSVNPQWQRQAPMPGNQIESGKKSDWALVSQPGPNQLQTADVSTTYAGMVEGIRDLVSRIESDGMSPELEAALLQQNFHVVCCVLHITTPSATGWVATPVNKSTGFQACCSLAILRDVHTFMVIKKFVITCMTVVKL